LYGSSRKARPTSRSRASSAFSTKTIETHRATAMGKLKLDTTTALIRYAIRNKLVKA
jgi:FixJ family two-component response regulator